MWILSLLHHRSAIMNLELAIQLLCLLQCLVICQSSYGRSHYSTIFHTQSRLHKHHAVNQRTYAPAYYFNHSQHRRHYKRFPPLFVWRSRHKSLMRHHFTRWTPWSKCNKDCIKRRERFCRTKRKCGKTKYVEEQKCWHCLVLRAEETPTTQASPIIQNTSVPQIIVVNTAIADGKSSRKLPETRHMRGLHFKEDHDFEELNEWKLHNGAIEGDTFQYEDFDFDAYAEIPEDTEERADQFVSPTEHVSLDALSLKQRRIYSKWSRWTKCSPKCTTSRYKKCLIREICGREILREISYCYTEGSFCQQWLRTHIQSQKIIPMEMRPNPQNRRIVHANQSEEQRVASNEHALQTNTILRDVIMHGKGYMGPEYMPLKLKCGISPMQQKNQRRRNMINMLKIIGGKASRKGAWPWQVAVFNRFQEAFCGGTLIAPQWVLTAAHCVRKVLYVRLGEHNLDYEDGTELQMRVIRTFKHPKFDKKTVDSDVALLKLPRPVNTTSWIGFSCLPRPYQPLPTNVECTVIGWGKRRNRDVAGTNVLHQAEVPIIPMENCRKVYQDYTITKNMFCAGHRRGRIDTCAGDSGGPLLCRDINKPNHPWTIFGITSFGDGCAKRNKFGIYTKVSNYVDWVWSVINCNGNCKVQ